MIKKFFKRLAINVGSIAGIFVAGAAGAALFGWLFGPDLGLVLYVGLVLLGGIGFLSWQEAKWK